MVDWQLPASHFPLQRFLSPHFEPLVAEPPPIVATTDRPHSTAFTVPESPKARDFAAKFYAFLSSGAAADQALIEPNPTRLMPGGLERIVPDGLALLGAGFLSERKEGERRTEEYMRPISGEKVVYEID